MKTTRNFALALMAASAALIVGCSTPDSRIRNSPDEFSRLNPDQQALVKAGQIAPGFGMGAVKLALGDPDRVVTFTDARGQHQEWHYVTYESYDGAVIYTGYYHRFWGWGGPRFYGGMPYYDGYPARIHDRIRVVFDTANLVASIEQEKT